MFDGIPESSIPSPSHEPPPDILPMIPMLRAEVAEIGVELLARQVTTLARDALLRPAESPRDGSAALPVPSFAWTLADAQTALWDACGRYCAVTGRDGLMLAHETIQRDHGQVVASLVLAPLRQPIGGLVGR